MIEITIAVKQDGEWKEVGALNVSAVPRVGEVVGLDDPGAGTVLPVGDFVVTQVKHYHYWTNPQESQIVVFLHDPAA